MSKVSIEDWGPSLKAAFVLGFSAGQAAKKPRSAVAKAWVARMVRWAVHCLTGGFFNPLDAYHFNAEFKKAFREIEIEN